MIDVKVLLDETQMDCLLKALLMNSVCYKKNLKMGKLMSAILTKYSSQLTLSDVSIWSKILERHSSFMKKSCEITFKKIASRVQ